MNIKLDKYNKLVHPELNGACAICGIDPTKIKQLFQELIDEVSKDIRPELIDMSHKDYHPDIAPGFTIGFNLSKQLITQRAKELLEKL